MFFELEHTLCKAYPALSPFTVDREEFGVVIDIFGDLIRLTKREKKRDDPDRIIRRPAGDDWF